jgi:hypothetical protein
VKRLSKAEAEAEQYRMWLGACRVFGIEGVVGG